MFYLQILPTPEEDDISLNEEDSEDENANYSINGNLIGLDSSNNYRYKILDCTVLLFFKLYHNDFVAVLL